MVITRTPFRVSFAGGGSDLAAYYLNEPGAVLSVAIDKYMYLMVKERFGNTFRVSYSKTEQVGSVEEIEHPIVRECLKMMGIKRGLEIVSMGDLPAGSGMGSSSSFSVGLLHALYADQGRVVSPERLAAEACKIEIERLREPIGKQDQYIAAYGGLQFLRFNADGSVFVDPVICSVDTREELNRRLVVFFTGITRNASGVLEKQRANTDAKRESLRELCAIAHELRDILTAGDDLNLFGKGLHRAWQVKKSIESSITNPEIDQHYQRGIDAGALGGKLLGAGGGGFLLFFCEPHRQAGLRRAMADLEEIPFTFDLQGSKVVYVGGDQF